MLISPWEIPTPDFQPGCSPLLFSPYFSSGTRLRKGSGAFSLQESPWLRQAPPYPSVAWGRNKAGSPQSPSLQQCSAYRSALISAGLWGASPRAGAGISPFRHFVSSVPSPCHSQVDKMKAEILQFHKILFEKILTWKSNLRKKVLGGDGDQPSLRSPDVFSLFLFSVNCNGRT